MNVVVAELVKECWLKSSSLCSLAFYHRGRVSIFLIAVNPEHRTSALGRSYTPFSAYPTETFEVAPVQRELFVKPFRKHLSSSAV